MRPKVLALDAYFLCILDIFRKTNGKGGQPLRGVIRRVYHRVHQKCIEEGGDFAFEGEITGYSSTTASVSSDNYAQLNRLTITVRVEFTNLVEPDNSFVQTFSQFADYDSQQLLTDIQSDLDQQIVDQIVTDIFMAAAANW